jgi:hypothetical protein
LLHHPQIIAPVGGVEADLGGADATLLPLEEAFGALTGIYSLSARRICLAAIPLAAEELPQGLAGCLGNEIPHRHLHGPVAAAVEVNRFTNRENRVGVGRIESDQQPFQSRQIGYRSTPAIACDALIGPNSDDGLRKGSPRHRIPGGREWWVQR